MDDFNESAEECFDQDSDKDCLNVDSPEIETKKEVEKTRPKEEEKENEPDDDKKREPEKEEDPEDEDEKGGTPVGGILSAWEEVPLDLVVANFIHVF